MNEFALAYTIMLVSILLEFGILKYAHKKAIGWREAISNLNSGHLVMLLFRALEISAFGLLAAQFNLHAIDRLPLVAQWVFGFIAWDFCFYWMHRLHHKIPLLWAVHSVHHQGEDFNLTLGVRNSWYSSLTNFPFVAWLAIIGLPLDIFVVVSSVHYTVQFYNHNAIVKKSGLLDRLMITPANHRVHHGLHPRYINKNFGGTFIWWDKLFDSFEAADDSIDNRIGVKGGMPSFNPLWFNHRPLVSFVSTYWPIPAKPVHLSESYIGSAGIFLFILSIYFVDFQSTASTFVNLSFFSSIVLATFCIGSMSDRKLVGLLGWLLFCIGFPIYCLTVLHQQQWQLLICFALLWLSAFSGCLQLWQPKAAQ